ncbi:hypothetical protein G9A89_002674 [Geosiphon pyriformis]|nr:hypothetical protein G9A89_002674 [Geosiphon pyriformis]
MVSSGRSLPILEAKQSSSIELPVLGNWADQMETESFSSLVFGAVSGGAWETIISCQRFSNVFGSITYVVLKSASVWQYVVIYFEKLDSTMFALNHWSVLMGKDSVRILSLVNQNETILSCNRFKTKLVNLPPGCIAFEISNIISQVSGQTCFIPWSPNSGCHFHFAIVTFGSQADLDLTVAKTDTLRKCYCEVVSSPSLKTPKVFKPCFVGFLSYTKASALVMSKFSSLVASVSSVAIINSVVEFRLDSLEKQISDLAALVKSIVEPVGSLVALVSYLLNDNAVKAV